MAVAQPNLIWMKLKELKHYDISLLNVFRACNASLKREVAEKEKWLEAKSQFNTGY